jgi:hypothetical protein
LLEVAVGGFLAALVLGLLLTVGGVVFGLLSGKTKEESGKGETPTENGERQQDRSCSAHRRKNL